MWRKAPGARSGRDSLISAEGSQPKEGTYFGSPISQENLKARLQLERTMHDPDEPRDGVDIMHIGVGDKTTWSRRRHQFRALGEFD